MALDVERVREIAERVAASSGLEVVELEFLGGGKARMLRVFLDKAGIAGDQGGGLNQGVTHEDCANFSREFGTILDVEDAVPGGSYTLEVSSPGLDRKLTKAADFSRFVGSRVKLTTRQPVNNSRHFEGRLESFHDGRLTLDLSVASHKSRKKMGAAAGQKMEIDFANVEKANLVPEI
jgi:ribosome maturation factor RimP